ncbi:hypothetical protein C8Q77DRAFT_880202 [Trametes polyzona]|nr:hypothetical protein C8Q77DRAFT_880202 [Trametes polyzona]
MVSVLTANVVTACIECTLYGIFFVLSAIVFSLWVRRHASESPRPRWRALVWDLRRSPLVIANLFFVVTITAHWVVGIHRLLLAVVSQGTTERSTAFYTDLRQTTEVIRCAFLFLDMLVGDVTITYRTWLVWRRDYRVLLFPSCTILGLLATAIALMYELLAASPSESIFETAFGHWIIGFCAATLVTNTYGTGMIMYRMWTTNRARTKLGLLTASGGSHIFEAMEIFIESAALYRCVSIVSTQHTGALNEARCVPRSAWTAVYVVLYAVRSPLQTVGSGCSPTITGISFMLITVRVNLGWVFSSSGHFGSSAGAGGAESRVGGGMQSPVAAVSPGRAAVVQIGGEAMIPMRTISLDMSRSLDQDDLGKEPRLGEDG